MAARAAARLNTRAALPTATPHPPALGSKGRGMARIQSQTSSGLDCSAKPTRDRASCNPTRGFSSPFRLGSARAVRGLNGA